MLKMKSPNKVKEIPYSINKCLSQCIYLPLKIKTKKLLEHLLNKKCCYVLTEDGEIPQVFLFYQKNDNSFKDIMSFNGNIINSKVINSKDSLVTVSEKNKKLKKKNKELKQRLYLYYEITEQFADNITEVYVKSADKYPVIKAFLEELTETQKIMSQIDTLSNVSEREILINNRFFEYYRNMN